MTYIKKGEVAASFNQEYLKRVSKEKFLSSHKAISGLVDLEAVYDAVNPQQVAKEAKSDEATVEPLSGPDATSEHDPVDPKKPARQR